MSDYVPIADVTGSLNQITDARNQGADFVNNLLTHMSSFSSALNVAATAVGAGVQKPTFDLKLPDAPKFPEPQIPEAFQPTELQFGEEPTLDSVDVPDPLTFPDKPLREYGGPPSPPNPYSGMTAPTDVPEFAVLAKPDRPDRYVPDYPTLTPPDITSFIGTVPEYTPAQNQPEPMRGEIKTYVEGGSVTARLQAHATYLMSRVTTGGTGLPAVVENQIWLRARDRETAAARSAEVDVLRQDAARGFYTPTGLAQAKLMAVRSDYALKTNALSRDIAIKQAELELSNIQKALELIGPMEQALAQADNAVRQRALDATRQNNEAAIQTYDAYLKGFLANEESRKIAIEVYKGEVQAYEAQVQAYNGLISAEKAKVEINKTLVEQYIAELNINNILLGMYKSEVDAVVALGSLEELKLKRFAMQVQAFEASTKAYAAEIQGKVAETQVYSETIRGYQAQLQGYASEVDAKTKEYAALAESYKLRQGNNAMLTEMYKVRVEAAGTQAKAETDYAAVYNQAQSTYAGAIASFNEVNAKVWESATQNQIATQKIAAEISKMNLDSVQASKSMAIEASKVGAQTYAQIVGSALSQMHYSIGASGSSSLSGNLSESHTFSGE